LNEKISMGIGFGDVSCLADHLAYLSIQDRQMGHPLCGDFDFLRGLEMVCGTYLGLRRLL